MGIAIKVENISKKYTLGNIDQKTFLKDTVRFFKKKSHHPSKTSDYWALKDISFSLEQGEVTGIIGRNGAGKSTLLKLISNIVAPTHGQIKINGRISSLLEVGTGFHPELTGRENIFLNGAILGMNKHEIARKFDEIVDFSGVETFIDTPVKRYSSGMFVRLAFSVAAFLEPEILILDEVLAVGDSEFQKKCISKMSQVSKNGQTVLFVSHTLPSIQSLCANCILLNKGELIIHDKTAKVIDLYLQENQNIEISSDGNLLATCIEFKLLNIKNEETSFFLQKELMKFQITYNSTKKINGVSLAIGINSQFDQRVTSFWSEFNGQHFDLEVGINTFEVVVPEIKLIPSIYSITTYLGKNGVVIEEIKNKMMLTIGIDTKKNVVVPLVAHGLFVDSFDFKKIS
jgi:lipopolysaccharide transport system ATP-binding protein